MRKNKLSAMLACLMAMILLSLSATPVFAKELSKEEVSVTKKEFISEQSAQNYANKMINELKDGELDIWNDTTEIDESVPMYDFEGNVNSYLFRLKTDGVKQGYIVVDARKDTAGVEICNDTGEYAVDIISKEKIGRAITTEDSIIRAGTFSFCTEEDNQTYKNFATDEILNTDKKTLISVYNKVANQKSQNIKLQSNDLNSVSAAPPSHMLPDAIGKTFFTSYSFRLYNDPNNCGPIAGTNFMYYWGELASNKQPALWSKDIPFNVYYDLKRYLGYPATEAGGTDPNNVIPGLTRYANHRKTPIKGNDYKWNGNIDWNFMKTNIANGNPLMVYIRNFADGQNHLAVAFGYESMSSGTYLRIADGVSSGGNTLLRYIYNGDIAFVGYVRW